MKTLPLNTQLDALDIFEADYAAGNCDKLSCCNEAKYVDAAHGLLLCRAHAVAELKLRTA